MTDFDMTQDGKANLESWSRRHGDHAMAKNLERDLEKAQRVRWALRQKTDRINTEVMPQFRHEKLQEAAQLAQRELDTLDFTSLEKNIRQEKAKALAKVQTEADQAFVHMLHTELSGIQDEAEIFNLCNEACNKGDVQFMNGVNALPWWSRIKRIIDKWAAANPDMLKLAEPSTPQLDKLQAYHSLVESEKAMTQNAINEIAPTKLEESSNA